VVIDAALRELRLMRAELAALHALMLRLVPTPAPGHAALLQALAGAFPGAFSSAEVLELAANPLSTREPLRQALAALSIRNAHQLGVALAQVVRVSVGQPLRLVRACKEANSRLWQVEGDRGA
jgi:hypothetical protein